MEVKDEPTRTEDTAVDPDTVLRQEPAELCEEDLEKVTGGATDGSSALPDDTRES